MQKILNIVATTFFFLSIFSVHHTEALTIQYGSVISIKYPNVIIKYDNIGSFKNYLCSVVTRKCTVTTKMTLNKDGILTILPDTTFYLDESSGFMSLYRASDTVKINTSTLTIATFLRTDPQTVYYIGNSHSNPYIWSLYKLDLATQTDKIIEPNVSYTSSIKHVDDYLIFNHQQGNGYGPEIYNLKKETLQQFAIPDISIKNSLTHQEVAAIGSETGILMTPKNISTLKSYPLVIWLHGGPLRQASYGYHPYGSYGSYDAILELLRKNDVIVLKLDYRGSYGFGKSYSNSIKGSVGSGDVTDVMNALAYAKTRYAINKTYLVGNSYGGYLSLRAIVEHPESFTGAFSINGVTDWTSLLIKLRTSIFNNDFDNNPPNETNQALYDQASIINRVNNLTNQKIAIVAGEADRTIPLWQALLADNALRREHKKITLTTYRNEDHVYKEKKTLDNLCKRMFQFVEIKVDAECNN
jgi:dipeptidyl aminopeptidase/acylaminoacyl peptidase